MQTLLGGQFKANGTITPNESDRTPEHEQVNAVIVETSCAGTKQLAHKLQWTFP